MRVLIACESKIDKRIKYPIENGLKECGDCILCGYSKCLAVMDFHHIAPHEKEGLKAHWAFEKNKEELDKCVLVCNRCHREIHAGEVAL